MKSLLHESSTNLHSSKYDEDSRVLTITFMEKGNAGRSWSYKDVPPELYTEIEQVQAKGESVGKLFHSRIRNTYKGEPVE